MKYTLSFLLLVLFIVSCGSDSSNDTTPINQDPKEENPISEIPTFPNDKPFLIGSGANVPSDKKWVAVSNMTDEFNDGVFNKVKWQAEPNTNGWGWIGRPPGLFEPENVSVADGNLNVTTKKFAQAKVVNGNTFTHGGGIVRSINSGGAGMYYECRMKANKTVMSSTFWLSFKQSCERGPQKKLELDIQECIGRVHENTAEWAKKWDGIFHSNTFRHNRECDTEVDGQIQNSGQKFTNDKNHERYFVYGCWWKSATEVLFYLDGEYAYSIEPPVGFDLEGHLTMAIETYDWNPIDEAGSIFETASFDDLTTKYDWIRTWKLEE